VGIEDAFELLVEAFDGNRAQFVEEATYLDTDVGMRRGWAPRRVVARMRVVCSQR